MGGYKGKAKAKKGGGKKGGFDRAAPTRTAEPHNFVADAGPGCVISHVADPPWALGSERIDIRDYPKGTQFPDLAVDPDSGTLAVVNAQAEHRVVRGRTLVPSRRLVDGRGVVPPFNNSIAASSSLPIHPDVSPPFVPNNTQCYVTVYDNPVLDRDGNPFPSGQSTDNDGKTRRCVTFILLVPPKTIVHAATLTEPTSEIDSDVQDWSVHPAPDDEHPLVLGFPLGATEGNKPGPWLCTQGEGGSLTHFFSGNLHAVDFRCEEGTPLLAVGAGTVVEVSQANTLTGVAVSNLFKWNSVMIQLDTEGTNAGAGVRTDAKGESGESSSGSSGGDLFVEYVHIKAGSVRVEVGDRVNLGDVVCESGGVGFSPEPHLHFTAFRSREPTAPTTRVKFHAAGGGAPYVPTAGTYYDASGVVAAPT